MYSGGPPVFLMWSGIFNPDKAKLKSKADLKRIRALFAAYRSEEIKILCCISLSSGLGLIPPLMVANIVDRALPNHNQAELFLFTGSMVLAALAMGLVGVYQGLQNHRMGEGIMRDLRVKLVTHLHRLPLRFFTETRTGEIVNRVANDVDSVDDLVSGTLITIVSNIFVLITTMLAMLWLDPLLTLISVAVLPLMILPLWPVGRKMYAARKSIRQKRDELSSLIQETLSISGITLLKLFNSEEKEREKFGSRAKELMQLEISLAMIGRWFFMLIIAMATIGPALIWAAGGYLVLAEKLKVGTVIAFVALLSRLYTPVTALSGIQVQIASALAVFERIFEYLDLPEEKENGQELPRTSVNGRLSFKSVCFSYDGERTVLDNLSFTAEPSQMVALVGSSGAGKSTLASLIPRFYETGEGQGSILLDGVDIKEYKLSALRSHIGMVTQETYLFHDTIKANLLYAKPDASEEELKQACRMAYIADFIESLPEGYETMVGERGYKLSGGERQRLSIARVLLKDPAILILDEATSSLDSVSEEYIQMALQKLMKGRTSIVIAHRLSTIESADQILVLEKGKIVESGTHSQLLSLGGKYTELAKRQHKPTNTLEMGDFLEGT